MLMKVVASWGMAPMAKNMMLRKETPKMAREPVAVFWMPENRDPMIKDMITTWISLQRCTTQGTGVMLGSRDWGGAGVQDWGDAGVQGLGVMLGAQGLG